MDVNKERGLSFEEAKAFVAEHNIATINQVIYQLDSTKVIPEIATTEGSLYECKKTLKKFNDEVDKKKRVDEILNKIDRSTCTDIFLRRFSPDLILKVRCTKPKGGEDSYFTLNYK